MLSIKASQGPERPDHGVFSLQRPNRTTQPCPLLPGTFSCSCFLRCRSKLVCCPKHRLHRWHLNGFSLLWMFRTCRWRLEEMLNDLSQYLHLKNRSKCQRVQCEGKKRKRKIWLSENQKMLVYKSLFGWGPGKHKALIIPDKSDIIVTQGAQRKE